MYGNNQSKCQVRQQARGEEKNCQRNNEQARCRRRRRQEEWRKKNKNARSDEKKDSGGRKEKQRQGENDSHRTVDDVHCHHHCTVIHSSGDAYSEKEKWEKNTISFITSTSDGHFFPLLLLLLLYVFSLLCTCFKVIRSSHTLMDAVTLLLVRWSFLMQWYTFLSPSRSFFYSPVKWNFYPGQSAFHLSCTHLVTKKPSK